MDSIPFLDDETAKKIGRDHGTPVYVYDADTLKKRAKEVLAFPNPYGLVARFAVKALPTGAVLRLFNEAGLHFDCSSGYEADRVLRIGVAANRIQITAQELPKNLEELVKKGVKFTACSLHQMTVYCGLFPGSTVTVRVNPGKGAGHNNRTNVGGPAASFGIWHEQLDQVIEIAKAHNVRITGMHTHIGSGGDPEVWKHCARLSLAIVPRLQDVLTLSLGGGFKVARVAGEVSANLQEIGNALLPDFTAFAEKTGRRLHLEIEPGTYLVANAGAVLCSVADVVSTSDYNFIKVDSGMTDVLRPSLYGSQLPFRLIPKKYAVVGHCCESGDLLTPAPGDPEGILPRSFRTEAVVGDLLVIGGCGAYCSSMSAKHYNSFPESAEVMIYDRTTVRVIRRRQDATAIWTNEINF